MSKILLTITLLALGAGLAACSGDSASAPPASATAAASMPTDVAQPSEAQAPTSAITTTTTTASGAESTSRGDLTIDDAWARQTPDMATNGAVYLTVRNTGAAADKLLSATAQVSDKVELHQTTSSGGMMSMEPVAGIDVPAAGTVELKPGGYHIMLVGLKSPLEAGQKIPVTLQFEKAGAVEVIAEVRAE
jgi:periplasmic copper chaperone A